MCVGDERDSTYSLIGDDGFAVAAFDGEGFFTREVVWCLYGQSCAGW